MTDTFTETEEDYSVWDYSFADRIKRAQTSMGSRTIFFYGKISHMCLLLVREPVTNF